MCALIRTSESPLGLVMLNLSNSPDFRATEYPKPPKSGPSQLHYAQSKYMHPTGCIGDPEVVRVSVIR